MNDQEQRTVNSARPSGTGGFLHPERILGRLDVRPGMVVADFGAGAGHYSLPLARAVGEPGKVYAIDIQRSSLDLIRSRAELEHRLNIETIWADLERPSGSRLAEACCDLVLISNILFQAEAKSALLAEARRVLKPGGKLAIIEWDEAPFAVGPPAESKVPKALARRLALDQGFEADREFEAGSHHYGLLFQKP